MFLKKGAKWSKEVEKKQYRTGFCLNRTNISTTVPTRLIQRTNTTSGTPYQYIEETEFLRLRRFNGKKDEAKARAKSHADVVFLQGMRKPSGKRQCKINMPRWVYDQFHLADTPGRVIVTWEIDGQELIGSIPIPGNAPQEAFAASIDDAARRKQRKALQREQRQAAAENRADPIIVPA